MIGTVEAIERELVKYGFVMRYIPDADAADGLPPGEGAFLACSFWLVNDLAMVGRKKEAEELFDRLLALRNDLGLFSDGKLLNGLEDAVGGRGSPGDSADEKSLGQFRGLDVPFSLHLSGNPAGEEIFDLRPGGSPESQVVSAPFAARVGLIEVNRFPFPAGPVQQGEDAQNQVPTSKRNTGIK